MCSQIMGELGLDDNSSLVFELEVTTYNCYNVDMGATSHEAPIPYTYEIPSTSLNKSKILDAKNAFD